MSLAAPAAPTHTPYRAEGTLVASRMAAIGPGKRVMATPVRCSSASRSGAQDILECQATNAHAAVNRRC